MHMADALVSPAVAATFGLGTAVTLAAASRQIRARADDTLTPLMGVTGAFVFAAQMVNFAIPGTGASGHLGGGLLLAALLGPHAAVLVMASVLTVQALFFADGGLLALGCNIWNLGVYPCFVAWPLVFRPLLGRGSPRRLLVASLAAGVVGLQLGAFSVVVQAELSGQAGLPFVPFVLAMQPMHLAIGIVEGLVTAAVLRHVAQARPGSQYGGLSGAPGLGVKSSGLAALALATLAVGGGLSYLASTRPDGLEWSVAKVGGDLASATRAWPMAKPWASLAGLVGAALVLALAMGLGVVVRVGKRKPAGR